MPMAVVPTSVCFMLLVLHVSMLLALPALSLNQSQLHLHLHLLAHLCLPSCLVSSCLW
jgi:hypothetical protein